MTACLTVYLVDDDADVRDALAFLLGSRGLTVLSFDSGLALLAALDARAAPPHGVFLLDIRMEPMSGTRLHDALIARQLRNPVLFLSGHGDIPMVVDALKRAPLIFWKSRTATTRWATALSRRWRWTRQCARKTPTAPSAMPAAPA